MQFILTGFTPDTGFRVFAFQGIGTDRTRTDFTVRTDLSLIRRYGIRMQELPYGPNIGCASKRMRSEPDRRFLDNDDSCPLRAFSARFGSSLFRWVAG